MKTYVVGGAIRDRLLGLPVADRDRVVVGATVDEMLAAGFRPVGKDFPVFLHPETHEEYALARTERKVAPGYAGFVFHADPTVTLEDDLARRDLTVNAMAEDEATGTLVDPFGGQRDVAARVFRHVSAAFVEDPVRILRVARFAARFDDFRVADETLALMRQMVDAGEVDALVPERVWQELARGLMEHRPSRMVDVLRACGAWARLLPELADDARMARVPDALDRAAAAGQSLDVRFALLLSGLVGTPGGDATAAALGQRLAVPRGTREIAVLAIRELDPVRAARDAEALVASMERCDAFRRPERFEQIVQVARYAGDSDAGFTGPDPRALAAARAVDAGLIARESGFDAVRIGARLHAARVDAVERVLRQEPAGPAT